MRARLEIGSQDYRLDFAAGVDLGIPLGATDGPKFFIDEGIRQSVYRLDGFNGAVSEGGGCNVQSLCLTPHCHGTHTEGYGHISAAAEAVQQLVENKPGAAVLVSLMTEAAWADDYPCPLPAGYPVMRLAGLQQALQDSGADWRSCPNLIIRSLPNPAEKRFRDYNRQPDYPLLSGDAIAWLAASHFRHLLIDSPSLDFHADGGRLHHHRLWWGVARGRSAANARRRALTEMIYVPDSLGDGIYWLEMNLSTIHADACPSNPRVYPLEKLDHD